MLRGQDVTFRGGNLKNGFRPLGRSFYQRPPQTVARELLGRMLVSCIGDQITAGIIVETEGYLAHRDSACHASKGRTPKSEVMFGDAGFAYVYPIHAKVCFNVVTQTPEIPSAVLIRAIEPMQGIPWMQMRRGQNLERDLARGPSRLCQAMAIDRSHNGWDLTQGHQIWIEKSPAIILRANDVRITARIGVTSAKERKLRYVIAANPFVSGPLRLR